MSFGIPVRNGLGIGLRASTALSTRGGASGPQGQAAFTTAGTFSWTAPAGVTSVCVVCVGGGAYRSAGGLGWKNTITVIPGNSYSLRVGNSSSSIGVDAQSSYFISEATVKGGGGVWSSLNGGTFTGDGGGNGGGSGLGFGGGGAGGYTGNGASTASSLNSNGLAGSGGGGGSGASKNDGDTFFWGGGGGGVGILGQGANGSGGILSGNNAGGGGGGSGGTTGVTGINANSPGNGGLYGGAGGAGYNGGSDTIVYRLGAAGAVRIIWGAGRAFPATNTGDV